MNPQEVVRRDVITEVFNPARYTCDECCERPGEYLLGDMKANGTYKVTTMVYLCTLCKNAYQEEETMDDPTTKYWLRKYPSQKLEEIFETLSPSHRHTVQQVMRAQQKAFDMWRRKEGCPSPLLLRLTRGLKKHHWNEKRCMLAVAQVFSQLAQLDIFSIQPISLDTFSEGRKEAILFFEDSRDKGGYITHIPQLKCSVTDISDIVPYFHENSVISQPEKVAASSEKNFEEVVVRSMTKSMAKSLTTALAQFLEASAACPHVPPASISQRLDEATEYHNLDASREGIIVAGRLAALQISEHYGLQDSTDELRSCGYLQYVGKIPTGKKHSSFRLFRFPLQNGDRYFTFSRNKHYSISGPVLVVPVVPAIPIRSDAYSSDERFLSFFGQIRCGIPSIMTHRCPSEERDSFTEHLFSHAIQRDKVFPIEDPEEGQKDKGLEWAARNFLSQATEKEIEKVLEAMDAHESSNQTLSEHLADVLEPNTFERLMEKLKAAGFEDDDRFTECSAGEERL